MRHQPADKKNTRLPFHARVRAETLGVHATQDHVRPRLACVAEYGPAVLADMQVPVIPAIRRDVGRNVPSSAAQIAYEHLAVTQSASGRRKTARQNVLLM